MKKPDRDILKLYQCELNRCFEEDFASTLSERNDLRLFFINENQAFTDGKNIVVDPANDEMFIDTKAMHETEKHLKLSHEISNDKYLALRMITRAQNIHETLHIIYSDFPTGVTKDPRGSTKAYKMTLAKISNIIEDAFIEAAGASEFDNMALYLLWGRISRLYANTPSEGTIQRAYKEVTVEDDSNSNEKMTLLLEFLNYFVALLLYPMIEIEQPSEQLTSYIDNTKQLFFDGSICGAPKERYAYTQKIFDIIKPLIPDSADAFSEKLFEKVLGGCKTHSGDETTIGQFESQGKIAVITTRLFTDLSGNLIEHNINGQHQKVIQKLLKEKQIVISLESDPGDSWVHTGADLKASAIHKDIKVEVKKPKINLDLKRAYQNTYNNYKLNINSYNTRFAQLLKGLVDSKEDKFQFGSGIASKHLADVKKRFWFRNVSGMDVPDIAMLFLVDGSGSMEGMRRNAAMTSCVILHEVLSKNNIEHAIVEHRAIYEKPVVHHNILIDFNGKDLEKYNIMMLDADHENRDGLALYWAEKYLSERSNAEYKVIITISDGAPSHTHNEDEGYYPPVSTKDTGNAVSKILKRGTDVIAVALDDEEDSSCYQALKEIYPVVVACNDLKQLTGKLLTIVSKLFG